MPNRELSVGEKIKMLRCDRGMTLGEVAEASGIPVETLRAIEDLTVSPPLGHIVSLAKVFRKTLGELFGDSADSPYCIVRGDSRQKVQRFSSSASDSSGYSYESLGHQKQNRQMEPFLVTLAPTKSAQLTPNQHVGEEILFVLEGQVEVRLQDHTDILNPGDSIYYDSTLPHVVSCHGSQPARILAVIYAKKDILIM